MLEKARKALAAGDVADNSVFTLLYSLLSELASDEEWSNATGTEEITELLDGGSIHRL